MTIFKKAEMLLIWALLLSGCGAPQILPGQIEALHPDYTAQVIQRASLGLLPQAKALYNQASDTYFLAWAGPDGYWAAVCFKVNCPEWMNNYKPQGMMMNSQDIKAIIETAERSGWYKVVVAGIPYISGGLSDILLFPITPTTLDMVSPQL